MRDFYKKIKTIMHEPSCITLNTPNLNYYYNIGIQETLDLNKHLQYVSKLSQGDVVILDYFGTRYEFLVNSISGFNVQCYILHGFLNTLPVILKDFKDGATAILPLNLLMTTKKLTI